MAIHQLLNIDREVNVITDAIPGELFMLLNQVMAHVGQQQNSPLMKAPFGDFSAECFIASTHTTAHKVDVKTTCTAADHTPYWQVHELCLDKVQLDNDQRHCQWSDSSIQAATRQHCATKCSCITKWICKGDTPAKR